MIIGTGTDIIETERVRKLIENGGESFLKRWFAECEIEYCERKANPHLHFAARMAAKEAVFKALRLPREAPLCWKDIMIESAADGAAGIVLRGQPLAAATKLGVTAFHVSMSHCDSYAIAMVTAEDDPARGDGGLRLQPPERPA